MYEERRWLGSMFDLKAAAAERVEKSGSKTPEISNDLRESNMKTIEKNNSWNLGLKHQRSNVDVERRRKPVQVCSTSRRRRDSSVEKSREGITCNCNESREVVVSST